MRIFDIEFYLNDRLIRETVTSDLTTLDFIRNQLGLTATKEVCAEGDCGACTIAVGRNLGNEWRYKAINSCLLPAVRLHGCHVITTEGLGTENKLNVIQETMLEKHAVQCGYCTSGMLMSLFCLLVNTRNPREEEIMAALEGNLCRCTGYKAIYAAATTLASLVQENQTNTLFFPDYITAIQEQLPKIKPMQSRLIAADGISICQNYYLPSSFKALFEHMAERRGDFAILNGASDLMVGANIHNQWPGCFIDLSNLAELNFIRQEQDKIVIGATVSFDQLLNSPVIHNQLPLLAKTITKIASTQIRNVATLAGNIANASPIADGACALMALNAELTLLSAAGERKVKLDGFYRDYKVTLLDRANEIISAITVPQEKGFSSFEKSAKRVALDIATVNSAINLLQDTNGIVTACRLVFGGVAKFPVLAAKTNTFLVGKKLTLDTLQQAAELVTTEFVPIADVRGSVEYRTVLLRNHLIRHLQGLCHE